ncbi:zinc finger domain-containing protein [Streptomyces camponoticapitis]|uniref:zinc finger domain-containing protein n=1 Tax=Streptomyces camponoticapitis TaxID=1616125 RepID=UPI004032D4A7
MDLTPDQAALAVEHHDCPNCDAPAGSACRTRGGKTAAKYHTPRFVLVPALREELEIPVPADRHPAQEPTHLAPQPQRRPAPPGPDHRHDSAHPRRAAPGNTLANRRSPT